MPLFSVTSISDTGALTVSDRYAYDHKSCIEEMKSERVLPVKIREKPGSAYEKKDYYIAQKRLFYRRLARAYGHKGFNIATTAESFLSLYPSKTGNFIENRRNAIMRDFLRVIKTTQLAHAMRRFPHVFTSSEIEIITVSTDIRAAVETLSKTMADQTQINRELSSALAWPLLNSIFIFILLVFIFGWYLPDVEGNQIIVHSSDKPTTLMHLIDFSFWLRNPFHLALIFGPIIGCVMFLWFLMKTNEQFQRWVSLMIFARTQQYGYVLKSLELRRVYMTMINLISTGSLIKLFSSAAGAATAVGYHALMRAQESPILNGNIMSRLRQTKGYIPNEHVRLFEEAWSTNGSEDLIAEIGVVVQDIDDELPHIIAAMKRKIETWTMTVFFAILFLVIVMILVPQLSVLLHLNFQNTGTTR